MFQYYRFLNVADVSAAVQWFQAAAVDLKGTANEGYFLTSAEFHESMQRGEVIPIDTRNLYESKIGPEPGEMG